MASLPLDIDPDSIERSVHVPSPDGFYTTLLVKNIHCPSCVSYANDVLRPLHDVHKIDISIIDQSIRVQHGGDTKMAERIAQELLEAAFEVDHVTTRDAFGKLRNEFDVPARSSPKSAHINWPVTMSKAQRKHIENCNACKAKLSPQTRRGRKAPKWSRLFRLRAQLGSKVSDAEKALSVSSLDSTAKQEKQIAILGSSGQEREDSISSDEWITTIGIDGMTCASCVGTITNILEPMDGIQSVNINLLANNGVIKFRGPRATVDTVVEAIEDGGYDATVIDIQALPADVPDKASDSKKIFRLSLSIDGMTCGSCVSTITKGLEELPFVSTVNIDLVGNRGVVEVEGENKKQDILEKIDDLGYDATELQFEQINTQHQIQDTGPKQRHVSIQIDGMYCEHCPENIMSALSNAFGESISVSQRPTLQKPIVSVMYIPAAPHLTVRRMIAVIDSTHEAFSASVYHPPSDTERSREMRHRDRRYILMRLVFTAIVAIPTFIIGIVLMSLVPKTNTSRVWLEQPVWAGNVSREEWALFIMTTPVMLFGADMFHRRAIKEIRTLWRRNSKVPILRRFYRFGSMNLLISLGTAVAYFSSLAVLIMDATSARRDNARSSDTYFDSVTFLTLFLLIGRFLEAYSKAKTGDAVSMLSNLRPSDAFLVEDINEKDGSSESPKNGSVSKVKVDMLEVGDNVSVPHGNSPPSDGIINQEGTFLFDESSLTGESKPVKKVIGDQVYAGSVNVSEPVRVTVTGLGGTSMLDQIVAVVREGQGKRAPIERVADVITGYFAPIITLVAITTWVIWLGLGESGALPRDWLDVQQGGWAFWSLEFAIAVFVVACPCGIGLAAPTALYVGGGLAAKNHILVQGGGEAFQEASRMDVIVFDKTGTLTEGKMKVTDFELLGVNEQEPRETAVAMALSKAMEESSTHPIATAIADYCTAKLDGQAPWGLEAVDLREVPGNGMRGTFTLTTRDTEGKNEPETVKYEAAIGNQRLMASIKATGNKEQDSDFYLTPLLTKYQSLGHSTAILALRRLTSAEGEDDTTSVFRPSALFAITDPLRATTASVLETLQRDHNLEVHMCTGDNMTTAHAVASQLGIPIANVRANVLPQDKAAYVTELQTSAGRRRVVAFAGDGTNDTPALSAADVSIAMSSGSDVAITTASFILLNSDLETILKLVKLAKRVFWRVKMNFAWAAVYNVCLVPVAAGVTYPAGRWRLGPVWASAAMAASSVSVVCSSLALRLPEMELKPWWKGSRANQG